MSVETNAKQKWDLKQRNPYKEFQEREGIPAYTGFAIEDVRKLELGPWPRLGGNAAFIDLEGTGGGNAAYVGEIPPGQSSNPIRHMYEEIVYILDGNGSTTVWYDENRKVSFEWGRGSLFAIPLNAWFRLHNAQGSRPARYLSVITAPIVFNLFHSERFVFDTPFRFDDRFSEQSDYFSAENAEHYDTPQGRHVVVTNFVPNIHDAILHYRPARGAGGRIGFWELAENTMTVHCSEFPVGTYKKRHRHGPGAHVIILEGQGFSLIGPEGEEPREVRWHQGSMVVPPDLWWHQHFNTGPTPARYLALRWGSNKYDPGRVLSSDERGQAKASTDVRGGGNQVEYDNEDPAVHRRFEAELTAHGAECRMHALSPFCTAPKPAE